MFAPIQNGIPQTFLNTEDGAPKNFNIELSSDPHRIYSRNGNFPWSFRSLKPLFASWSTFRGEGGIDAALINSPSTRGKSSFVFGKVDMKSGDKVWTVGYIGGQTKVTRYEGVYVGKYLDRQNLYVFDLYSEGGMSGAPIIHSETGRVVAILNGPQRLERKSMDNDNSWLPFIKFDAYGTKQLTVGTSMISLPAEALKKFIQIHESECEGILR